MKYFIPLVIFIGLIILLAFGLSNSDQVKIIPSTLIDKPAPPFNVSKLQKPNETFSPKDMRGKVWILNVWASWCASCRAEHEVIKRLVRQYPVHFIGLNYKDEKQNALLWLSRLGNPYQFNAVDADGDVGIDWGVYGVPESYIIDKKGIIRHKVIGVLTDENVKTTVLPMIKRLEKE